MTIIKQDYSKFICNSTAKKSFVMIPTLPHSAMFQDFSEDKHVCLKFKKSQMYFITVVTANINAKFSVIAARNSATTVSPQSSFDQF